MRISVQLRAGQSRWARSVFVDTINQPHVIPFDDFRAVDEAAARRGRQVRARFGGAPLLDAEAGHVVIGLRAED